MFVKKAILLLLCVFITSCQVEQTIDLNKDGSGRYTFGFDASKIMAIGASFPSKEKQNNPDKNIDTLIVFSDFLKEHQDSIKSLPKEEQLKLKELKDFDLKIKVDTASKKMYMKLGYNFLNVAELDKIGEVIENQNVKELNLFIKSHKVSDTNENKEKGGVSAMVESYMTEFDSKKFTRKLSEKAFKEAQKDQDTSLSKDNPFVNLIRFKQVIKFPYKIKKVHTKNLQITSDFKGVEQTVNLYNLTKDPRALDVEVEFE